MFCEGSRFRGFAASASPRIMFLKRLLVCYALCGVYYSEDRGLGDRTDRTDRTGKWSQWGHGLGWKCGATGRSLALSNCRDLGTSVASVRA